MSKRDKALMKFVADHRKNRMIKQSVKNRVIIIQETLRDIEEGPEEMKLKRMNYKKLVHEMNEDMKALEHSEKPIVLFKESKEMMEQMKQETEKKLESVKKVVYPVWAIIIAFNSVLLIAYYY